MYMWLSHLVSCGQNIPEILILECVNESQVNVRVVLIQCDESATMPETIVKSPMVTSYSSVRDWYAKESRHSPYSPDWSGLRKHPDLCTQTIHTAGLIDEIHHCDEEYRRASCLPLATNRLSWMDRATNWELNDDTDLLWQMPSESFHWFPTQKTSIASQQHACTWPSSPVVTVPKSKGHF